MERELLAVVSGARQGAAYGTKIRLPHAFVKTFLFRPGSLQEKLKSILKLTFTHTRNLAAFVALYKATLLVLRHILSRHGGRRRGAPGKPEEQWHAAVAGFLGGYVVWGNYSSVNYQITMYVFARVAVSAVHLAAQKGIEPFSNISFSEAYPWATAAVWGAVMYLWEYHAPLLQPSLRSSMDFLYRGGDHWRGVKENLMPSLPSVAVLVGALLIQLQDQQQPRTRGR